MSILRFAGRQLGRAVVVGAVTATLACILSWPLVVRRANNAFCSAVHGATSKAASLDLAALRDAIQTMEHGLAVAKARRTRLADLLAAVEKQRQSLASPLAESRGVLREIAGVLASEGQAVSVNGELYRREIVEKDACTALRRYEQTTRQMRDLEAAKADLKQAVARVDTYIGRAEAILSGRDHEVARLEQRAEYQRLLHEIGQLVSDDADGFEMRLERVQTLLTPFAPASGDPETSGVGREVVSTSDLLPFLATK